MDAESCIRCLKPSAGAGKRLAANKILSHKHFNNQQNSMAWTVHQKNATLKRKRKNILVQENSEDF